MIRNRSWDSYLPTYRASEMQRLASWIVTGESGSVVGLPGCGRSNVLGFLFQRTEVLASLLGEHASRVILVYADLINLPGNDLSNFYRTLLHAFYWVRNRFPTDMVSVINDLYLEQRAIQDPFLSHKALLDLLLACQQEHLTIVLIINRFDRFCSSATPTMVNSLRSLRDNFKSTLCYIVGMQLEPIYLSDPALLGDMYELLDSHICRIGALSEEDAQFMLTNEVRTAVTPPSVAETRLLLSLSGRFPSLLRAVGQWWLLAPSRPQTLGEWCDRLLEENSVIHRLDQIWGGLTQEEKLALFQVQHQQTMQHSKELADQQQRTLHILHDKGLCFQQGTRWQVNGELLAAYILRLEGRVRGKIWIDPQTRSLYQGDQPIEGLTGLRLEIMRFFLKNPRVKLTGLEIIDNVWPDEEQRQGIAPNALQVHIAAVRKLIEPNPASPRYLITWHGRPGGYQFFPEGRPE